MPRFWRPPAGRPQNAEILLASSPKVSVGDLLFIYHGRFPIPTLGNDVVKKYLGMTNHLQVIP